MTQYYDWRLIGSPPISIQQHAPTNDKLIAEKYRRQLDITYDLLVAINNHPIGMHQFKYHWTVFDEPIASIVILLSVYKATTSPIRPVNTPSYILTMTEVRKNTFGYIVTIILSIIYTVPILFPFIH